MIVGLDVGTKRIGVAYMHESALLPVVHSTISVSPDRQISEVVKVLKELAATTVVLGFPRRLDGSESMQTKLIQQFGNQLICVVPDISLVYQDESLTSVKAEEELEARTKGSYSKEAVDSLAAVYILQDYSLVVRGLA